MCIQIYGNNFYKKEDSMNLFGYYDMMKSNNKTRNIGLLTFKDLMSDHSITSKVVEN